MDYFSAAFCVSSSAKLVRASIIPLYTHYSTKEMSDEIKKLSKDDATFFETESQDSAVHAAAGACACERRSLFTMAEKSDMQRISFLRLPVVGVSTANFHNRNCIVLEAGSNQEIIDMLMLAYRVCEDKKVMLPGIVNITNPSMREAVHLPSRQTIDNFLPKLKLPHKLDSKSKHYLGAPFNEDEYLRQQNLALMNTTKLIKDVDDNWSKKFKTPGGFFEGYMLEDAENVFVVSGYDFPTAKIAVKKLRDKGEKVGALRFRVINPFEKNELRQKLSNAKKIAVLHAPVYSKVSLAHNFCQLYIKDEITEKDFEDFLKKLKASSIEETIYFR